MQKKKYSVSSKTKIELSKHKIILQLKQIKKDISTALQDNNITRVEFLKVKQQELNELSYMLV